MPLNDIQLKWIINRLSEINEGERPWTVRAKLAVFIDLLKSRLPKEEL